MIGVLGERRTWGMDDLNDATASQLSPACILKPHLIKLMTGLEAPLSGSDKNAETGTTPPPAR